MALEYKKFNLDDNREKEIFEDLLSKLTPEDVVELTILERQAFGRVHSMEAHIVFNGDYSQH